MRLEDFRGLHTGDVAAWWGADDVHLAAFHQHANQAHWHTINCLIRLSGSKVDGVASDAIGIIEWWRTAESLIALLHEIAVREGETCVRPGQRPLQRQNADVITKWRAATNWFSGGLDTPSSDVTGRLSELRDFRNSFEHASRTATRTRRHSRLSATPAHANEVDLMEALAICVSTCEVVRSVVPGLDLMPQVVVPTDGTFFFEAIDVLAAEVVLPIYQRCLDSLGLTSDVALYPRPNRLQGTALVPVALLVRSEDERQRPPLSQPVDALGFLRTYGARHARRPAAGEFALPAYMVQPVKR